MLIDLAWYLGCLVGFAWYAAEVLHWLLQRHAPCQHQLETLFTGSQSLWYVCRDCGHITPLGLVSRSGSNKRVRH